MQLPVGGAVLRRRSYGVCLVLVTGSVCERFGVTYEKVVRADRLCNDRDQLIGLRLRYVGVSFS